MPQIDLEQITIASPCTADWDAMQGDERVRFCGQCELNVYNLSAMEREEAQAFVRESEGKVCVRMFKRRDGTVITQDCPVGLRAILRRRLSWLAGLAASLLATVGGVFAGARAAEGGPSGGRRLPVVAMGAPTPIDPVDLVDMGAMEDVPPVDEPIEPTEVKGEMVCPPEEGPEQVVEPPDAPEIQERMGRIALPR